MKNFANLLRGLTLCFLLAVTQTCVTREPEFLNPPPANEAKPLDASELRQWYEKQAGPLKVRAVGAPVADLTADSAASPSLNWAAATTARVGTAVITSVPFADAPNRFAGSGYHGWRHLLLEQRAGQAPKAAVVEVFSVAAQSAASSQAVLLDLYRFGAAPLAPSQSGFAGFAFFYDLRYGFRAGRRYGQGRVLPGHPRLYHTGDAGAGPAGTAQRPGACVYTIISHDPPYGVDVCDHTTGANGGGYGGPGGPGGGPDHPADYPLLPGGPGDNPDPGSGGDPGDGSTFGTYTYNDTVEPDLPSDCNSWQFRAVGPSGYMACGVRDIEIDLLSQYTRADGTQGVALNVYKATLYFEMPPRYTPGEAATICADLKDEVEEYLEGLYANQYPPDIAQTINSTFIREMTAGLAPYGGRVTLTPRYANIPMNNYQHSFLPHTGPCY